MANAHEVARPIAGQAGRRERRGAVQAFVGFPDGEAADGIARQVQVHESLDAPGTQGVVRAALHDAEEQLVIAG